MNSVGYYVSEQFKVPVMFYRFRCNVCKTWVVNYKSGQNGSKLICPICIERERRSKA